MIFFSIISSHGSVAVPPPPPPPSEYFDPVTGDITFTDEHFQFSHAGYAKTGFTARSPGGFVEFRTSDPFQVKIGGNWSGHAEQSQIFMRVDGVFNQAITLTADNTTQNKTITALAAGERIVRIVNGYAANAAADGHIWKPENIVCVQGIIATGPVEIKRPPTLSTKVLLVGMSITTGASGTRPTDTSWAMQMRNEDEIPIQLESYGARILANNSSVFGTTQASALVAHHLSQFTGVTNKEVWIDLATNDFYFGASKATYKARLTLYVTTMQAADPTVRIILIKPTNRADYNTANVNGATLGDMDAAMSEVASEQSIEVMGHKDNLSTANTTDGLHPNQTGQDQIHDNLLPQYLAL